MVAKQNEAGKKYNGDKCGGEDWPCLGVPHSYFLLCFSDPTGDSKMNLTFVFEGQCLLEEVLPV